MTTYQELIAQSNELLRQANILLEEARSEGRQKAMALIEEFSFTAFELGLVRTQTIKTAKARPDEKTFAVKTPKAVNPPKYRDPDTGKTWSGRGHEPLWINGDRDAFLIKPERQQERLAA
jgi:DNA-binding protein H-NS